MGGLSPFAPDTLQVVAGGPGGDGDRTVAPHYTAQEVTHFTSFGILLPKLVASSNLTEQKADNSGEAHGVF